MVKSQTLYTKLSGGVCFMCALQYFWEIIEPCSKAHGSFSNGRDMLLEEGSLGWKKS